MKKSRNLMAILIVFAVFASLNTGALAANESDGQKYQLDPGVVINLSDTTVNSENVESWAYKDYFRESNSEKANILKARSIMMQKTDWVADGFIGYYTAPDGTVEEIPSFSEVFPDWDIKQIWAYNNKVDVLTKQATASKSLATPWPEYFNCNIPVATDQFAPMKHITSMVGTGNYTTTVLSLNTCTTCNIGYNFKIHGGYGEDVGFKGNIPVGGNFSVYFRNVGYMDILRIRVSTYSTAGSGSFVLDN